MKGGRLPNSQTLMSEHLRLRVSEGRSQKVLLLMQGTAANDTERDGETSNSVRMIATRSSVVDPSHHCLFHIDEQVIEKIGTENAKCTLCWRWVNAFSHQHRFHVLDFIDDEKSEKVENEDDICKAQENTNQHTKAIRHAIVAEKDAADEREAGEQNRETLQVIETVKLHAVRTTFGLKVKGHDQDEGGKDSLDAGAQFVREDDDDGEDGLSGHDHRFPENVLLTEGTIDETSDVVDPAILVVFFHLYDNDVCDKQRKPKAEDKEERACQQESQCGMGSLVTLDAGIQYPVICRAIYSNRR